MRTNLSAYQGRILWAIFRRTYGFNQKEDWISNSQLVQSTGIFKGHVSRAIRELMARNIVTKRGNKIGFNKDYQQWRELPIGVTRHDLLPNGVTKLPNGVSKVTNRGVHKRQQLFKDILVRERISKRRASMACFEGNLKRKLFFNNELHNPDIFQHFAKFYDAYPKKRARRDAAKAWAKLNPDESLFTVIMGALEKHKALPDWKKDNGQYIPLPASWINGRRWEDEIPEVKPTW